MSNFSPKEVIRLALLIGGEKCDADLILRALEATGHKIVPADGATAPGAPPSSVPSVPKPPTRGPVICPKCDQIRGNGGDMQKECDRADCPF